MKPDKNITGAQMAFGVKASDLLPRRENIPEEFFNHHNKWNEFASSLFFEGGNLNSLKEKEGVDRRDAIGHIRAILVSFEPEHNHKIAGVAYLFSLWFEELNEGTDTVA